MLYIKISLKFMFIISQSFIFKSVYALISRYHHNSIHSSTSSLLPTSSFLFKIMMISNKTKAHKIASSATSESSSIIKKDPYIPSMIVFDLDDCLWSPEMHTLSSNPRIPIEGNLNPDVDNQDDSEREIGVFGMKVIGANQPTVTLFDGARRVLREIALDSKYQGVIVAAASTSLEPTYSHACLNNIEILPGLTMRDMFMYDQIGRTGHLTDRKLTHFQALHKESGIPYNEMLFFDDCNWGDHCADVTENFGVVSQRTPHGMELSLFHKGMEKYRKKAIARSQT